MINIPQIEHDLSVLASHINVGPKKGPRFYLDALYASLVYYRPKLCLEIGTHTGNSARIFQKYFNEYMPDGKLITCDLKQYVDLSDMKNIVFVQVHPHMDNMAGIHYLTNDELLVKTENNWGGDSVLSNIRLVLKAAVNELPKYSRIFDFAFIDGDHQRESAISDISIAKYLLKPDSPILFDDTDEFEHDCAKLFHEEIKLSDKYETYEFDDWNKVTGCAIILPKD